METIETLQDEINKINEQYYFDIVRDELADELFTALSKNHEVIVIKQSENSFIFNIDNDTFIVDQRGMHA